MIKLISFDCFGVLLADAWLAFLDVYSTPKIHNELTDLNKQWDRGIIPIETYVEAVHTLTGATKEEVIDAVQVGHVPNQRLRTYISQLKEAGYSIGLLSNIGGPIEGILPSSFSTLFDTVTLSYATGFIKPDKRIFEHHISSAALHPEEIVFIDDRQVNVDGAVSAGMSGVLYTTVTDLKKQLSSLGVQES